MSTQLQPGEWYGKVERTAHVAGVRFSIVQHERARRIEPHVHARPYFVLLVSGEYCETVGSATIDYEPFTFAFHPAPLEHHDAMGAASTLFAMELDEDWEARVGATFDTADWRLELQRGEAAWLGVRLLNAFLNDELDPLEVDATVSEMLGTALRIVDRDRYGRPWVRDVEHLLKERFAERVSLAELTALTGLHPSSLARGFRLETGVTMGEYLNRIRVQHACRLIAAPGATLGDVAAECGFSDQSHMTRTFKTITGMPPGQLRNELNSAAIRS